MSVGEGFETNSGTHKDSILVEFFSAYCAPALRCFFASLCTFMVILLGIFVNFLQAPLMLTSLYDHALFYHLNSFFAYSIWRCLQLIFEKISRPRLEFTAGSEQLIEDVRSSKKVGWKYYWDNYFSRTPSHPSAIVISNHCNASDWYMIHAIACRLGCLGYLRYVMKDSIKFVPIFGWGMKMMNMVFLKRNWFADMETIQKTFQLFSEPASRCLPVWIVSFPEGSRITQEKKLESQAFCKANNKKTLNHVLYPRIKGFVATIQGIRHTSNVQYVYDFTLAFYDSKNGFGAAPSLVDINILGDVSQSQIMVDVKRFALKDLPTTDEGLSLWLQDLFYQKDEYLESFKNKWALEHAQPSTKED